MALDRRGQIYTMDHDITASSSSYDHDTFRKLNINCATFCGNIRLVCGNIYRLWDCAVCLLYMCLRTGSVVGLSGGLLVYLGLLYDLEV